jgi:hypothetical protein
MKIHWTIFLLFLVQFSLQAQTGKLKTINVQEGWAANSINAVVFRKNSLTTFRDTQFIAFYNQQGYVMLGKRKSGNAQWIFKQTPFKANITDAHNNISIITDGKGFLHLAWGHHDIPLNYCKSTAPGSLDLTDKIKMTGLNEQKLTYPEFYNLPDGNLLFFFRNGASGRGNLVINKYNVESGKWAQLHENLIDGEGKRNAYWQACVDAKGTVHLSWVWRESPDVESNHDMCYAKSDDAGLTWKKSSGEKYYLPINDESAEYACKIPENSELINQTSMCADENGNPYIATYWRNKKDSVPQYHIIYKKNGEWEMNNLSFRKTVFSLSGGGTKRIPISRPQIIPLKNKIALIFRDEERGNKVSIAIKGNPKKLQWKIKDILSDNLGSWEPTYDTQLWKEKTILNLFVQKVEQAGGEGLTNAPPQMIKVLEWKPKK